MDYAVRITLASASPAPTYTGGIWSGGIAKLSGGSTASGWTSGKLISVSQVGESVDIAKGGNYAILSDCAVTLPAVGWDAASAAGVSLHNALIEIGTLSGSALTPRWTGYVADMEWAGVELILTVESLAGRRHREIPLRRLTSSEIPVLPSSSEGSALPIIWGSVDRMTPPKYSQTRQYLDAFWQVQGGAAVARKSTFYISGTVHLSIGLYGSVGGVEFDLPDGNWTDIIYEGGSVYIEIVNGTGSGQTRACSWADRSLPMSGNLKEVAITVDAPFDPPLDSTSEIKIFANPNYASLAIADEALEIAISADVDGIEYPVASEMEMINGVKIASVSSEFLIGENYSAIMDVKGTYDFGTPWLIDGVSASGDAVEILPTTKASTGLATRYYYIGDILCRSKIDTRDIKNLDESIVILYAINGIPSDIKSIICHVKAEKYDGSIEYQNMFSGFYVETLIDSPTMSAYNSALREDGTNGFYAKHALNINQLSGPISSYISIDAFVTLCKTDTVGTPVPTTTAGRRQSRPYTSGDNYVGGIYAEFPIGWLVRPVGLESNLAFNLIDPLEFNFPIGRTGSEWRTITAKAYSSGSWVYTIDSAFSIPSGTYEFFFEDPAAFYSVNECEASIAFVYGEISESSAFMASAESGRSLPSSDPIVFARDAALNMLSADLSIPSGDIDSSAFSALDPDPIHTVIASPEMSSDIYAKMCREFNWIGAHDSIGRETAMHWLDRVGTATQDYAIANGDIIAGSIEGPQMTAIEDMGSMPTVLRSWTQADSFRATASTLSLGIAPASLTEANYRQYVPGWDSFAMASDAYAILHANRARYGIEQQASIEYRYSSDMQGLLIDSGALHWVSSRKEILEFSVLDNNPGAWAVLGSRFAVTHRRYAPSTKRGTLVARFWNPEKRTTQLTIMIDPVT